MVMKNKEESAFPHPSGLLNTGMTLRDYFAATAMQGILASWPKDTCMYKEVAAISYEMADEMLEARNG
jgi:hypothetical protein